MAWDDSNEWRKDLGRGSPGPVLTPETQNVRRKMVKWNRRGVEMVPSASGCGQMLGEVPGGREMAGDADA